MIECHNLTKSYAGHLVLDDLNLTIPSGLCALLGPNGAGKSTLLKLLTGLDLPGTGTLRIASLDLARHPIQVRRRIGVLPDQLGLFDSLSVLENLQAVGPVYGLSPSETRRRALDLLTLLDLDHGRDTLISACSFGMKKKTALALALLHNPQVLFLDEPFEGIDPTSSRTIEQLLTTAATRGITILFTSHILPLVQRLAHRILLLHHGRIAWDSSTHPLTSSLEDLYFSHTAAPALADPLPWLGA
jgi:ABC-2 type transport system ATP-binding protein